MVISTPSATSYNAKREGSWRRDTPDGVRNLLTTLIGKVWTNVEVEPQLQPLDNEGFKIRSAVTSPESRRQDGTLKQVAFGPVELQHFLMSE